LWVGWFVVSCCPPEEKRKKKKTNKPRTERKDSTLSYQIRKEGERLFFFF
jgi:hypothetical protein